MLMEDFFRYILLAQGGFTLGIVIIICIKHLKLFAESRKIRRMLLPWHIVAIGVSHALAVLYMVDGTIGRLGEPFSYRTALAFVSLLLSNVALLIIAIWQKRRGGPKKSLEKR